VRNVVDRIARSVPAELREHAAHLRWESDRLVAADDAYILHEHLADHAHPTLIADLARRASDVGLRFLGDAIPHRFSPSTASTTLAELTQNCDLVDAQQYFDFTANTAFRQSLFVRTNPDRERAASNIRKLWVRSQLRPTNEVDLMSNAPVWFEGHGGGVSLDLPIVKAAVVELCCAAPGALRFDELVSHAMKRLGEGSTDIGEAAEALSNELCLLVEETDLIELRTQTPVFETRVTTRPIACPHARRQARVGGAITNRWHHEVRFDDPTSIEVLKRLDGTRTAQDIANEIATLATDTPSSVKTVEMTIEMLA
jgi:methyltransferase-like protein